jgi:hypothetical protein
LHVGGRVAVHVGIDDHVAAVVGIAKLAGDAGKCGAADEGERLVAADQCVRVDGREIDQVEAVAEAADDRVAKRRSGRTVGNKVEIEPVVPGAAVENIAARAADQRVVADASGKCIVAGSTDDPVIPVTAAQAVIPEIADSVLFKLLPAPLRLPEPRSSSRSILAPSIQFI